MKFHTDFKIGIRLAILFTIYLMLIHWVACIFYKLALADYTYYVKGGDEGNSTLRMLVEYL